MPEKKAEKMLSVRVPAELLKRLRQKALDEDSSNQAIVIAALEGHLPKKKRGA
jgi:predicted HicB family RNase H-like nuclease